MVGLGFVLLLFILFVVGFVFRFWVYWFVCLFVFSETGVHRVAASAVLELAPQTRAGLELRHLPASASQVLLLPPHQAPIPVLILFFCGTGHKVS